MALAFDGVNDYVDLGDNVNFLRDVGAWTVMAWVKADSIPASGDYGIVSISVGSAGATVTSRCTLEIYPGSAINLVSRRLDGDASISLLSGGGDISTGTWYHLAGTCVYGATRDLKIYKNGIQISSSSTASTAGNTSNTAARSNVLGAEDDHGSNWLDGTIEDVRLYARALSAAEMQVIYASLGTDGIADTHARWPLNEYPAGTTATSTIYDLSNSKFNGTPTNSPVYQQGIIRGYRRAAMQDPA